jgi:phosphoglycerate kinase
MPSVAGRALQKELEFLTKILGQPERPVMAIVGGSKVSTKLELLDNLLDKMDCVVVGGGMANTFLAAQGKPIGQSLVEEGLIPVAKDLIVKAEQKKCRLILPTDVLACIDIQPHCVVRRVGVDDVESGQKIADIGPETTKIIEEAIGSCQTVVWNGPVGVFEVPPFHLGSEMIAKSIAEQTKAGKITSVAGGGGYSCVFGASWMRG